MRRITIVFLFLVFLFIPFIIKADLTTDYNKQYNALQQQILDIKTQYYQNVANIKKSPIGLDFQTGQINKVTNDANLKIEQIQLQEQQLYINYQSALNDQQVQQQQQTCPANSYNFNGQCVCNAGYLFNGGACITPTQSCQNQYGVNSYGDANNCYCNTGYQLNSIKTACVLIPSLETTNQNVATSVINQKPVSEVFNPTPTPETNHEQKTIITQSQVKPQSQTQPKAKAKVSHNIFSNIWNFIKNILK